MEARYMTDLEWRICHAVNIYLYRNGQDGEAPVLVHIPPAKKKNMKTVMSAIQERVSYPVGYAAYLFKMDGKRVRHPCELEMYNNYVVASNYDKHFKCAQYGRKRSPLLVLNRDSKHIRVLRQHNENYHEWMLKKKAVGEERPQFIFPAFYTNENAHAQDLPVNQIGNEGGHGGLSAACPVPAGQVNPPDNKGDYVVNTCAVDTDAAAKEAIKALQDKLMKEMSMADMKDNNGKKNRNNSMDVHKSDILNANAPTTKVPSGDGKSSDSETGMETDCMGSKYQLELKKFKKDMKKRAAKERSAVKPSDSSSSIEFAPEKAKRRNKENNNSISSATVSVPPPPHRFRDANSSTPRDNFEFNAKCSEHSQMSDVSGATYCKGPINQTIPGFPGGQSIPGFSNGQPVPGFPNGQPIIPGFPNGQTIPGFPQQPQRFPNFTSQQMPTLTPRQLPQNNGGVIYHPFMQFGPAVYPLIPNSDRSNHADQTQYPPHISEQKQMQSDNSQTPRTYSDSIIFQSPSFIESNCSSDNSFLTPEMSNHTVTLKNPPPNGHFGGYQQPFVYAMVNPMQNYVTLPPFVGAPPSYIDKTGGRHGADHLGEKIESEVDIPFTPFVNETQAYHRNQNPSRSLKVDIAPARSRNVAIQMGFPTPSRESRDMKIQPRDLRQSPRRSLIPVKISFDTPNGQTHLDQGFILPPKSKLANKSPTNQEFISRPQNNNGPTCRVYKQTSNAATQITGDHQNPNIRRILKNPLNIFNMEKYLEGIERENLKQYSEVNELSTIPPPSAFQESFRRHNIRTRGHPNDSRKRDYSSRHHKPY